jgi:hypothetical protein
MLIRDAQKHADPTEPDPDADPDPQHCLKVEVVSIIKII